MAPGSIRMQPPWAEPPAGALPPLVARPVRVEAVFAGVRRFRAGGGAVSAFPAEPGWQAAVFRRLAGAGRFDGRRRDPSPGQVDAAQFERAARGDGDDPLGGAGRRSRFFGVAPDRHDIGCRRGQADRVGDEQRRAQHDRPAAGERELPPAETSARSCVSPAHSVIAVVAAPAPELIKRAAASSAPSRSPAAVRERRRGPFRGAPRIVRLSRPCGRLRRNRSRSPHRSDH